MKVEHRSPDERVRAKRRVLVVDDHAGFRSCASELLQAEGFEVVGEAEDGSSALAHAEDLKPELVLLDIQLPDLDGFEVAERLLAANPELAIVLVSSRDRSSYGPLVEQSGARGFVSKSDLSGESIERLLV
ncbi:MAG TPA: response regulator transcription factor [Gaiellaceae bacterium]|nr:response regulator transcription factor [Gaiellaceae bacterium]